MTMRITTGMLTDRLIGDLGRTQSTLAGLQRSAATGQKINKPSDDATGTSQALRRRDELDQIAALTTSANSATSWLQAADTSLQSATDVMHRVKELTTQAANGTATASDRASISTEIDSLIASLKDSANAKVGGQYIFSGQKTDTAPYATATGNTYQGDTGVIARQIGPGVSVQANATADSLWGSGGADGKLLSTLTTIKTHLAANDTTALSGDLDTIDQKVADISTVRATLGSTQNRVDAAIDRLGDAKTSTTKLLGDVQNADFAETLLNLSQQQNAYTAALKSGASIIQTSLLDFIS